MLNFPITLTAQQWNVVLFALQAQPFRDVHLIVAEIKRQGDALMVSAVIDPASTASGNV